MILYLDTTAFVRLDVREAGHERMRSAARAAAAAASRVIAYAEMRAALARMRRMERLLDEEIDPIKQAFEMDWPNTIRAAVTDALVRRAGESAERFSLRGHDSVHPAAAESLTVDHGQSFLRFASFDRPLNEAASVLGMRLLDTA